MEARDKRNHQNSWSKLSFKCLKQSKFLCSFHLVSEFLILSPIESAPHEHVPRYVTQLWCFTVSLLLNKYCIFRVLYMIIIFALSLVKFSRFAKVKGHFGSLKDKYNAEKSILISQLVEHKKHLKKLCSSHLVITA